MIRTGLTYSGGMAQKIQTPDISINTDRQTKKQVAELPGHGLDDLAKKAETAKNVKQDPATEQTEQKPVSKTTAKKTEQPQGIAKYLKDKRVIFAVALIVILFGIAR